MPYITVPQSCRTHQITLEEILRGEIRVFPKPEFHKVTGTVTRYTERLSSALCRQFDRVALTRRLHQFNESHKNLFEADRASLYHTFKIPKRSGGLRTINQPNDDLMAALRELAAILQNDFGALYHTSAFAYVKGRSTVDAVKKHQMHRSRWFLKIDFENFFGNTTLEFAMRMLEQIFPFSEVMKLRTGSTALEKAISLCFLDGGLPQGTPISPMLTNLLMIPIDYKIANSLVKDGFVYTRYADDSIISHSNNFMFTDMCTRIEGILAEFQAPFTIKRQKTRYGSNAGSNWNLGVMLNKDNQITIGHKKKRLYKTMICNYLMDKRSGISWPVEDVRHLQGLTSYYRMVEKQVINEIIRHYNQKTGLDFEQCIRDDLR